MGDVGLRPLAVVPLEIARNLHRKLFIGDGKLGEDVFGVNLVTLNSIVRLSVDLKSTTVCAPSVVNLCLLKTFFRK
jgi:hypothetical protein